MKRSFYSLRHGETDWNVEVRLQGHSDIPLNDNGRQQASAAATILKPTGITRIISSDLSRAVETESIVAAVLNAPLVTDKRLREIGYGKIEGMTQAEVNAIPENLHSEYFNGIVKSDGYRMAHGGEHNEEVFERVWQSMIQADEMYKNDTLLFVWHGGVHRRVSDHLLGINKRSQNAVPYFFEHTNGTWALHELK
jgi:probable phosphoglycerate mutase